MSMTISRSMNAWRCACDFDTELLKKFDHVIQRLAAIVGNLGALIPCLFGLSLLKQADGHFRVSKRKVINEIAKRHNGGGHPLTGDCSTLEKRPNLQKEKRRLGFAQTKAEERFSAFCLIMGFHFDLLW